MRALRVVLISAIVLFASMSATVRADGIICKLPEDGAWVRYASEGKGIGTNGAVRISVSGTVTVSSVGREIVNGEACRWIEIEMASKFKRGNSEGEMTELYKLLIPETHLTKGENPRDHVVNAMAKQIMKGPDGKVKEVDRTGSASDLVKSLDELFQPPFPNVTKLDPMEIDTKLGKLPCAGEKGDDGKGFSTEVRLHDKSPFGVVTYQYEKARPDGSKRMMSLKLADFGKDAKSKFPKAP